MADSVNLVLDMHLGEQIIGELSFDTATETFAVNYTNDWQQRGFPISPMIPLDGSGRSNQISMFLVNLLPENKGLDYLIESLGVSRGNTFALVRGIGLDTAGAIAFSLKESLLPETSFRAISDAEVIKRLEDPDSWPMEVWDGKPRLSVAGVQSKLNLFYNGKAFGFAEGALSSTHILKFEKHQHLVINEFLTMRLAKAISMHVANVEISYFGQYKALCVERFDRRYLPDEHKVLRRHIIDSCQTLGFSVNKKYERNFGAGHDVRDIREGVSFARLFGLASQCSNPAAAKQDMLQWALFNLLSGNADAHGKNYSFFMTPEGLVPTPWYDLVCVTLYDEFEQEMAMAIDDEFDPNKIYAYQLASFIEDIGLPRTLLINNLTQMATKITQVIDNVIVMLPALDKAEQDFVDAYKALLLARCERYLASAAEIKNIEL
ncbi:HipA domain-containing protein [Shewanella sp. D64]|uniref:HipA domain-containing protein n=1 Tax=unclassified Shewanella TaxID=196818 RepID=UPI0022BA67D4|nr:MULTISPECIES: HipA domain-containing protein [unclassified Shewanella]MEC4725550.1 HipA domain-containing protein [Shewanella sp. D64]MEC4738631.1 HipA domain-containing protein [Shewanella sp. E94]WBJ94930.1 HipA domain-containing protein [Shewanella sp. MTB7]